MTPLNGADGQIYVVAQGAILAGGASAEGQAARIVQGVPTSGTIPSGGRIEREVDFALASLPVIRMALRNPDFTTAARIEAAVNSAFRSRIATMLDSGTVSINIPEARMSSAAQVLTRIERLSIEPEQRARVVVDQRSGTIVMSDHVRISRVAVAQGGLTLRVEEAPQAVQPNPFTHGETIVVPRTNVEIQDDAGRSLAEIRGGTSLSQVVAALNALGVAPRDMIDILKTINATGALHADFIVQ